MIRAHNPAFSKKSFTETINMHSGARMTYEGTMQKSFMLLLLVVLSGSYVWGQFMDGASPYGWMIGGAIAGFILALVTIFNKKIAMYTAPAYALAQGLVLGGITAVFEVMYPGIAVQAVLATLGVFLLMLMLYKNKIIQVSERFTQIMMFALGGVFLTYLAGMIAGFFGVNFAIFGNGPLGIAFSAVVAGVAALSLLFDFELIEQGVKQHAPKFMEWYASFGLLVTLVWLYIEILRLIAKLRSSE